MQTDKNKNPMTAAEKVPMIVPVLVPMAVPRTYDYLLPAALAHEAVKAGDVVLVPLGRRETPGVVWDAPRPYAADDPDAPPLNKLKAVIKCYPVPALPAQLRDFVDWVAQYVMASPGAVLKQVLSVPAALEPPRPVQAWCQHRQQGNVRPEPLHAQAQQTALKITPARQKVFDALADGQVYSTADLARQAGVSSSVVTGLAKAGHLQAVDLSGDAPFPAPKPDHMELSFSDDQQAAVTVLSDAAILEKFHTFLLDGVTGSGKTEVYFEGIAATLRAGRQALVLLPEIALTTNFLGRFEKRFGSPPAVWHSGLSAGERRRTWRAVAEGQVQVLVGARSGLFLPWKNLGMIIVDEEHDAGFKQEDGVIYNARDMAVVRGRMADALVVLSSATPSLETYINARDGRYETLRLAKRHGGAEMPDMALVDMRLSPPPRGHWLSPPMVAAMDETLTAGRQALLFLNRRGYAPLTLCQACGHRYACASCDSWLVEHRFKNHLACHQCGITRPVPEVCDACGEPESLAVCGPGVERVTEEVGKLFPDKRVTLMSSDLMRGPEALGETLDRITAGETDIIVGTQIVAKGHHFPALGFVGVVDADLGLGNGDLRAAERTFQMLSQVSGRAGRESEKGRAMLQSYMPDHPVLQALVSGDRDAFLHREAEMRELAGMPPFGRLAGLVLSGPEFDKLSAFSRQLAAQIPPHEKIRVLGPAPAPIARIRNKYRIRFLIKSEKNHLLQGFIKDWLGRVKAPSSIRITVDIDPYSFL